MLNWVIIINTFLFQVCSPSIYLLGLKGAMDVFKFSFRFSHVSFNTFFIHIVMKYISISKQYKLDYIMDTPTSKSRIKSVCHCDSIICYLIIIIVFVTLSWCVCSKMTDFVSTNNRFAHISQQWWKHSYFSEWVTLSMRTKRSPREVEFFCNDILIFKKEYTSINVNWLV